MTTIQFTKQAKGRKQLAALIAKALQIPVTPMNIAEKAGTVEFPWFSKCLTRRWWRP
ncbi:hypothetical protein [Corynebacterium atypicum]|uniref:hypothetical protein n=1 Tax=Corynebacterium atypicum TaxID=191610 RepID=UPI000B01A89A|nr:hypothetical protein [Corynebacterium atypicum]